MQLGKLWTKGRDWLIVVLGVGLAIKTGQNVWRLYRAGERVGEAQVEVERATEENQRLRLKLEYVQSEEFIEKEALEKLGMGRPGEKIVVGALEPTGEPNPEVEEDKPNWRKWWELYIGI